MVLLSGVSLGSDPVPRPRRDAEGSVLRRHTAVPRMRRGQRGQNPWEKGVFGDMWCSPSAGKGARCPGSGAHPMGFAAEPMA